MLVVCDQRCQQRFQDTQGPSSQWEIAMPPRSGRRAIRIVGCRSSPIYVGVREGRRLFRRIPFRWALVLPPRQLLRVERESAAGRSETGRSGATLAAEAVSILGNYPAHKPSAYAIGSAATCRMRPSICGRSVQPQPWGHAHACSGPGVSAGCNRTVTGFSHRAQ